MRNPYLDDDLATKQVKAEINQEVKQMDTGTREEQLAADTLRHFTREQEDAADLWDHIDNNTVPEDEELAYYFEDGYFDTITWINSECLDCNSKDMLLATGGPAYGVTLVQGHPYFWFQDWFVSKRFLPFEGKAAEFYEYIFDLLTELDR